MITIEIEDEEALRDPVAALSDLFARPESAGGDLMARRKYLRLTDWIEDGDRGEARELFEEFVRDFDRVVGRIAGAWGPPDFRGEYDEPGYPEGLWWSPYLAYWVRGERVGYVVCDQQDNELPLELYLGTLPTAELRPRQGPLIL